MGTSARPVVITGPHRASSTTGGAEDKDEGGRTGEEYNNEYCWWYRIVNGTVVEIVEYLDTELVTNVLGR